MGIFLDQYGTPIDFVSLMYNIPMKHSLNRSIYQDMLFFLGVAILVFLTRLMFLSESYGVDDDAWRIALAARDISVRQIYRPSRLPGYPVPEILYSLVWQQGPKLMGGITAVLSSLGSAFFYLTLRKLKIQDSLLIAFTFAITPIIFINSTNTMDYLWSLSFVLGSLYFIYSDAPWPAGILLGLAIGSRITAGVFVILFPILMYGRKQTHRAIFIFIISALMVGGLWFLPAFLKSGFGFLGFYDVVNYPSLFRLAGMFTVNLWGHVGSIALVFVAITGIVKLVKERVSVPIQEYLTLEIAVWTAAILLMVIMLLRLPLSPGYLIPAVPFVYLFIAKFSPRWGILLFCLLMWVSPFVKIKSSGIEPGALLEAQNQRERQVEIIQDLYTHFCCLDHPALVYMRSDWIVYLRTQLPKDYQGDVLFEMYPDENTLPYYLDKGYTIYYDEDNLNMVKKLTDVDFTRFDTVPFSIETISPLYKK